MTEGWSRRFLEPIRDGRRELVTLRDAANYVIKLPKAEAAKPHWQIAMRCLIMAGDQGGILMLAEIAMRIAIRKKHYQNA